MALYGWWSKHKECLQINFVRTISFDLGLSWTFYSADRITIGHISWYSSVPPKDGHVQFWFHSSSHLQTSSSKFSAGFQPRKLKSCIPHFTVPQLYWYLTASQFPNLETEFFFCKSRPHASFSNQVTLITTCSQRWWWSWLWASQDASALHGQVLLFSSL